MAVTVYVKLKLKRLNNRLNIRELNSAKVNDFKRGLGGVGTAETVNVRIASMKLNDFRRGRGSYPDMSVRLNRLKNRLNRLSISVRAAVTVDVRLNRLNNSLNRRGISNVDVRLDRLNRLNRLNRFNNSLNRRGICNFNNKNVKNGNYLVKPYRIRFTRLNESFKNVKKGRGAVWEILIPILQHFFHFCHIIFDV